MVSCKYSLCCIIINYGLGSKVLKLAKNLGVSGGTIFLGKGSVKNHLLELFDLTDIRKEIVLFLAEEHLAQDVLQAINTKFKFSKPNHGIAFCCPLESIVGSRSCQVDKTKESRGFDDIMYKAIFTIVDRGNAESVIDAAEKAGSQGGTIINARGSGVHEKSTLFAMTVEPEKEIVLILSEKEKTDAIVESIKNDINLEKPGNGILFIMDTISTYGIFKKS